MVAKGGRIQVDSCNQYEWRGPARILTRVSVFRLLYSTAPVLMSCGLLLRIIKQTSRIIMPLGDANFCLPINLGRLQNERLRLVPIDTCPDSDLEEFVVGNPELWRYLPSGPFSSVEAYRAWHAEKIQQHSHSILFAIYLKEGTVNKRVAGAAEAQQMHVADGTFAGTTGLTDAVPRNSMVEIGHVIILPRFHRTFVNTVSTSLLMKHVLDPIADGDLNMRRVQWQANGSNRASITAAQRLGFELEGIMRYARTINDNKDCVSKLANERSDGLPVVDATGTKIGVGRHSAMLAVCWDDWLEVKRNHVLSLLEGA